MPPRSRVFCVESSDGMAALARRKTRDGLLETADFSLLPDGLLPAPILGKHRNTPTPRSRPEREAFSTQRRVERAAERRSLLVRAFHLQLTAGESLSIRSLSPPSLTD